MRDRKNRMKRNERKEEERATQKCDAFEFRKVCVYRRLNVMPKNMAERCICIYDVTNQVEVDRAPFLV